MSSKLIIVADLQRFKLFATRQDPLGRGSVELLQSIDSLETHQRLSEKVSDQKGNFQGVGASGAGEDHNLVLEEERRRIKEIAAQITRSLGEHPHDSWSFAAPKAINHQIVELLSPDLIRTMALNLTSDLTKTPNDQLLDHFAR